VEALEERCVPALITVTTLADDVTPNDGSVSLREAINAINNATPDPDITNQHPGTFGDNDRIVFDLAGTINLQTSEIPISKPVVIQGLGADSTIINGPWTPTATTFFRLFNIAASAGNVTLLGLTLQNGATNVNNNTGGAIHCESPGTLTIGNSIVSGNRTLGAVAGGGALFTRPGSVTIYDSTFSGNYTTMDTSRGGAIYSGGGPVTVTNSTFSGNFTKGGGGGASGGAIAVANASVTITNSTLSGNHTDGTDSRGGAIFVRHDTATPPTPTPEVTITNSTLSGNYTMGDKSTMGPGSGGGAIYARQDTIVAVTNSTISGNTTDKAGAPGGGIFADTGAVILTNSTVSGNQAKAWYGGGIFDKTGDVELTNSTVAYNYAYGSGGGIYANSGNVVVTNSTVSKNSVSSGPSPTIALGGGILDDTGQVTLSSSIVADNTALQGGPDLSTNSRNRPINLTATNSLVGNADGTSLTATGFDPNGNPMPDLMTGNLVGAIDHRIPPGLEPLHDNGGPAQTMALRPDSPAIDRGDNPIGLATDQRGFPFVRAFGAGPDMGAFELQPLQTLQLVVTSAADRLDTTMDPTNLTLRDAIAVANNNPGPDTITFAPALSGVPIQLSLGQLEITDSVTIQGLGAPRTVIDAQQRSRIFYITATDGRVILDGMTLTGGRTTAGGRQHLEPPLRDIYGDGGAIRVSPGSAATLTITNSTLSGSSTRGTQAGGGAVYSSGALAVINSTFSGNATYGDQAGGGAISSFFGSITLTNSTVSGNSTRGDQSDGGGIFTALGRVTLFNSTVSNNKSEKDGGGIFDDNGTVTLTSSIVADNGTGVEGSLPDISAFNVVASHSLVGYNKGTPLVATGPTPDPITGNLIGEAGAHIDPMLGMLQDNGGPTQTMALLPGSPAIDRGSNPLHLTLDQRGLPRVFDAVADMGAFELQPMHLHVRRLKDTLAAVFDLNDLSLRDAVALANNNPGPDTITFDPSLAGVPIRLDLGELLVTETLTIQGLGAANTVIDAQQLSRIFNVAASAGGLVLDGLTLTGGRTTGQEQRGGALLVQSEGTTLEIRNSAITGSSTLGDSSDGGAIFTYGSMTLNNSTIAGNSTHGTGSDAGGIEADGNLMVANSTITGSSVQGEESNGSGLECFGDLILANSTVAGNTAPAAGVAGIDSKRGGSVTLRSSIVAGNRTGGGTLDLHVLGTLTASHSLVGTNQGTSLEPTGPIPDANGNLIGSAASPLDPRLGPLADNGGPMPTLALLPGSPAIDRGDNAAELATDQRGGTFVRQAGAAVDMGAFEVQLQPPPPPPQAKDDHVTVLENSGPTPLNVLANDSGSGLTVTDITAPLHGQVLILPGGIGVSYLPSHNFDGADPFTYTVTDADGRTSSATVFIDVSDVNYPPHAADDAATMLDTASVRGPLAIAVLANDSGNFLQILAFTQGAHGSVNVDPVLGQSLTYLPNPGFTGTDQLTYTIKDDMGRTATANVTVTVVDTRVPMAHDDTFTVPAHLPSSNNTGATFLDVLANDTGRFLFVTAVTQPAHGSVQIQNGGLSPLRYQPNDNYTGPDAFTYTVTDDKGQTATASVSLTVVLVDNTTLHVQDQTATVPENGALIGINPLEINLLAHDTGTPALFVTGLTQPAHGTLGTFLPGSFTASYAPDPDFAGTDTFTYTVMDGNGNTATANVNVTVVGSAAPLAAHDDAVDVPAVSQAFPIDVLGNDTGSGIHVTAVTPGAHGTATILPFGIGVTYQPTAGSVETDQLSYTITDATGQTATAIVRVTALAPSPPTARVTGPATGQTGQTLTFTLGASEATSATAGFTYTIDWGDRSPRQTIAMSPGNGAGVAVAHVFAQPGSFTVTVTATDANGLASMAATTTLTVTAPPLLTGDVTSLTGVRLVGSTFNRRSGQTTLQLLLVNNSTQTFAGPVSLVLAHLPRQFKLRGSNSRTKAHARGSPFVVVSTSNLAPHQSVSVKLIFSSTSRRRVQQSSFVPEILAGPIVV
jgi:CSLREA domain-containing protein